MIDRARSWHIPLSSLGPLANLLIRYGLALLVQAVAFSLAIAWLLDDSPPSLRTSVIVVVILAVLNTLLQPILTWISMRFWAWFFPVISFILNGSVVLFVVDVTAGWQMGNLLDAGILVSLMAAVTTLTGSLLSISDDRVWSHFALRPLRARYGGVEATDEPGFAFLEIDGLSIDAFEFAREHGYLENLSRWIETGSHRLTMWECDLSSQTGASQAGILQGNNHNLPAYRWYDKELGRVVTSTLDAHALEARLSNGEGLLSRDGASRGNLFSGDAPDSLFTFSTLRNTGSSHVRSYYFYFASPYNIARTAALFFADILRELVAALWQLARNERPRVRRFGFYPIVRAGTTSLLRELSTFTVAGDMMRGVPAIYTTYIAYDEVAHHSGIYRGDTLRVLRDIDRDIGRLQREAERAPRPYHLIVLSDHGQSQGPTFRQQFGETLGEHVQRLIAGKHDVAVRAEVRSHLSTDEGWQAVSAVLTELTVEDRRRLPETVRRMLREQVVHSEVELSPEKRPRLKTAKPEQDGDDVVVVASGNLGLISFPQPARRLTLEEIDARYPNLIAGLVLHPGIAFVMVRSARNGSMAIGNGGVYVLETDEVVGENPLKRFGPNAPRHLRRTDGFDNVPDIVVNSGVDPLTGTVFAFEELVGSHGGLGGPQSRPFILFPGTMKPQEEELVGAEAVNRQLRRWMAEARLNAMVGSVR
jgi:putative membrane protein